MLLNPYRKRPLQGRAFMLALQYPKRLAAEVSNVGLLSFSLAGVTRKAHVFSHMAVCQLASGADVAHTVFVALQAWAKFVNRFRHSSSSVMGWLRKPAVAANRYKFRPAIVLFD